jgi:two-component system, cell cycle sensor histidine kinase and response regulator CckA
LQMTSASLEAHGYQVIKASDGPEALAIFAKRYKDISAVLLDMMMPGMDGIAVLDEMLKIEPKMLVIACSGLRTTQREIDVKLHGAKDFLAKPYSEEQLLQALGSISKRPE